MFDSVEEFNERKERIKRDFWDIGALKISNPDLKTFYLSHIDKWLENANQFRLEYPTQTTRFWARLLKSSFVLKFLGDEYSPLQKIREDGGNINENLRILKNCFENSYHYFCFITICANYSRQYVSNLPPRWCEPSFAAEKRVWHDGKDLISGKYWALLNCPLLTFSPIQARTIRRIKNLDSHERLIVKKKCIVLLDESGNIRMPERELTELVQHLRSAFALAFHFYCQLFLKFNYWTLPLIYLVALPDVVGDDISFEILAEEKGDNTKDVGWTKGLTSTEKKKSLFAIYAILHDFAQESMWAAMRNEKKLIDSFLVPYSYRLDLDILERVQKESRAKTFEFVKRAGMILDGSTTDASVPQKPIQDSKENDILERFGKMLERIRDTGSTDEKLLALIYLVLNSSSSILLPIKTLRDNLRRIIIPR